MAWPPVCTAFTESPAHYFKESAAHARVGNRATGLVFDKVEAYSVRYGPTFGALDPTEGGTYAANSADAKLNGLRRFYSRATTYTMPENWSVDAYGTATPTSDCTYSQTESESYTEGTLAPAKTAGNSSLESYDFDPDEFTNPHTYKVRYTGTTHATWFNYDQATSGPPDIDFYNWVNIDTTSTPSDYGERTVTHYYEEERYFDPDAPNVIWERTHSDEWDVDADASLVTGALEDWDMSTLWTNTTRGYSWWDQFPHLPQSHSRPYTPSSDPFTIGAVTGWDEAQIDKTAADLSDSTNYVARNYPNANTPYDLSYCKIGQGFLPDGRATLFAVEGSQSVIGVRAQIKAITNPLSYFIGESPILVDAGATPIPFYLVQSGVLKPADGALDIPAPTRAFQTKFTHADWPYEFACSGWRRFIVCRASVAAFVAAGTYQLIE